MKNEYRQGCELPLTKEKWRFWMLLVVLPLFVGSLECRMMADAFKSGAVWMIRLFYLLFLMLLTQEFIRCFGKLHMDYEGIVITLFGKTLQQFPRERIRFLGGVKYRRKYTTYKWIAVCDATLVEFAELEARKRPKILNGASAEFIADWVLRRYAASIAQQLGFRRKDILLLEWSPECLAHLRKMYPMAQWVDLTEGKVLDAERVNP